MRKGFIFSLDAAMALVIVAVIALLFATQFQVVGPDEAYPASERVARDYAIVGGHLGKDATDMGISGLPPGNANYACVTVYKYGDIQVDGSQSSIDSEKYCKGIG